MEGYLQYRRLKKSIETVDEQHKSQIESPDPTRSGSEEVKEEVEQKDEKKLVQFGTSDPSNPREWSYLYRIVCFSIIWQLVFVTGWASAADSTSHEITAKAFHVSEVAESLGTAMYLFGVGIGAVVAGPCSETLGRLATYLTTFAVYLIWVLASAVSANFGSQIVFRFFAGLFASASMSIYGGSMADMFGKDDLELVWPCFALSPLLGPTIAPLVSGWISQYLGWRWVDWITLMISGSAYIIAVLFLPETFSPMILSFKARGLRHTTGDSTYQSEYDQADSISKKLGDNLRRIVFFIFREPTTILFGFYLTLLYLLIYGFLEGFDYIFTKTYDFSLGSRYTAFASVSVGIVLGLPYVLLLNRFPCIMHRRKDATSEETETETEAEADAGADPEQRLLPALFAAPLLTISLFWLGWTNRANISYWSDIIACGLFGFALMAIFSSTYHYLLDSYGTNAASAMAAITFMRYLASGGIVLATEPMYKALTVEWTLTLLGCVAGVLTPVPWVFWRFGTKIRAKSRWACG